VNKFIDTKYLEIVNKFASKSIDISNKALDLSIILDTVEKAKINMENKEDILGLSSKDKPYGSYQLEDIENETLVYELKNSKKELINSFIQNLELYFEIENNEKRIRILEVVKNQIASLKQLNENPKKFIISPVRAKVWNIIENHYLKTIKKLNTDLFIDKLKMLRIKHQDKIDYIFNHYQSHEQAYRNISIARKNNDDEEIKKQSKILSSRLSPNISELLVDTSKIISGIDFNLEEIPMELSKSQVEEFKKVLPAISEYFVDQTYSLSGGHSYTNISNILEELQEAINKGVGIREILKKVSKLGNTIQHLYVLHWIAESLLKDILDCFGFRCSIGTTIRLYQKKFENTKSNFDSINTAIRIRNDIAHNALIWDPKNIGMAIINYSKYLKIVASERNINLDLYKIPRVDREMSQSEKNKKTSSYLKQNFSISLEELQKLDQKISNELSQELEQKSWKLNDKAISYFNKKIENKDSENFAQKYFKKSFIEIIHLLTDYDKEHNTKKLGSFFFMFKNRDHENFDRNLDLVKNALKVLNNER